LAYDPYVYPGTNVLKNTYGIRDQKELDRVEADIVGAALHRLLVNGVSGELTRDWHKSVHHQLFGKLYPFAGKYREMNIAKFGEALYANHVFLDDNAAVIFHDLERHHSLQGLAPEEFRRQIAKVMGELHVLHPFREGNTRTLQVATFEIAARAGHHLDWQRADPKMIRQAGTAAAFENYLPYERILEAVMEDRRSFEQAAVRVVASTISAGTSEEDRAQPVRQAASLDRIAIAKDATAILTAKSPTAHVIEDDVGSREIKGQVIATSALHAAIATSATSFVIVDRSALDAARSRAQEVSTELRPEVGDSLQPPPRRRRR